MKKIIESELRECPFCGCSANLIEDEGAYKVFCNGTDCDAQYGWCATEQEAVDGWNRRKGDNDDSSRWNYNYVFRKC